MPEESALYRDIVRQIAASGANGCVWIPYAFVREQEAEVLVGAIRRQLLAVRPVFHCGAWYLDIRQPRH